MHLTSAAVKGLPSCHLTPWCSGKVSSVPSSLQFHSVASSGTIKLGVFCGSSCLNMTRLLNTAIVGRLTAAVNFLEHRHAGGAVEMADFEDSALTFAPMQSQ